MNLRNKPFKDLIREGIQNRHPGPGFTVQNQDGKATIRIYDIIGWPFIEAEAVARELESVNADEIEVQISSPGGDVFDGIAIYNALRSHPASITTRIDSMAASIASVVAQAGDTRIMLTGSQMMIHEAHGIAIGPASEIRTFADTLDKQTDIIADIYAERSGGDAAEFRQMMTDESWFDASETVDAGLADEVTKPSSQNRVPSKFAADVDSLVGEIEAFAEEAENVVAFRSSQGKPPLSDDVVASLERAKAALSGLVEPEEAHETTDPTPEASLDWEQRRHEWLGRKYERSAS